MTNIDRAAEIMRKADRKSAADPDVNRYCYPDEYAKALADAGLHLPQQPPMPQLPGDHRMTTPKTYCKRAVEVRAMRLIGTAGDTAHVTAWMNRNGYPWLIGNYTDPASLRYTSDPQDDERPTRGIYIDPANGDFIIRTLEGDMRATYGDWIIQGVAGEFYPCKPDIFDRTYEETPND